MLAANRSVLDVITFIMLEEKYISPKQNGLSPVTMDIKCP